MKRRMLDLFAGRLGWSKAFLARGWDVVAIDLVEPPEVPQGCIFIKADILSIRDINHHFSQYASCQFIGGSLDHYPECCDRCGKDWRDPVHRAFDFICASSPCEQFSVHGMKHFHPKPPYPEMGIKLFNYTQMLCEASGAPYVMENVRPAQQFVGNAVHHCGPFYLWGSAVPPLVAQGVSKTKWTSNRKLGRDKPGNQCPELFIDKKLRAAILATIPPELSNAVADYAERLCEVPA